MEYLDDYNHHGAHFYAFMRPETWIQHFKNMNSRMDSAPAHKVKNVQQRIMEKCQISSKLISGHLGARPQSTGLFVMESSGGEVHVTGNPPPSKTDFENEKYIIILYLFCTILYTKSKIFYTIPSCGIGNSNLGGWWHAAHPKCSFKTKNRIIILYLFCTILYTMSKILYTLPSCAIGNSNLRGLVTCSPQM